MEKIGIFYGSNSGNTELVAQKIQQELGEENVDLHDIAETAPEKVTGYVNLIFGTSTWDIGDLQDDWAEFINFIKDMNLKDKVIALYGLGDQENYPDSFASAMRQIFDVLICKECKIVGSWPTDNYTFTYSDSINNNEFVGLVIDEDVQKHLTDSRIKSWVEQVKPMFK